MIKSNTHKRTNKVSIITACFNAEATIETTILSVLSQTYDNWEMLICDGSSLDQTLNIVQKYKDKRIKLVSRWDTGIYDAMNKGLEKATGTYIHILNADDQYADSTSLEEIVTVFEKGSREADVVYSGIRYVDEQNNQLDEWIPEEFHKGDYMKGFHVPHPGFFATLRAYKMLGNYNSSFQIAADFDLMLRFMESKKIEAKCLKSITVLMRADGKSSRISGILKGLMEVRSSLKDNTKGISLIKLIWYRYIPKLHVKILRSLKTRIR